VHPKNLQAFLDYHWQVQTYKEAEEERNQEVTRAVDEHQRATQALLHLLPFEVPLHYTYQGERDRLQNQPYRIVKIAEGLQVHKQTP
jgi:hypothetical protein